MLVAALQTDIVWEDPQANFAKLRPLLARTAGMGAELLILPEMYACGFSMNAEKTAEPFGGPSVAFLVEQAATLGVWLCGSVPERPPAAGKPANTFILAGPAGELHRYRKRHPFTFGDEHLHYVAGDERITIEVSGLRVSPFVCYDLRFADDFWLLAPTTDLYVVVANWPERRREHWKTLLRARAIENQAWVVGLNRVGDGNGVPHSGDSMIIDPWGEIVVSAARDETILLANIDPQRAADARLKFPVLADRR